MSENRRDTGQSPLPDGPPSSAAASGDGTRLDAAAPGDGTRFPPPPDPPAGPPSLPHGRPDLPGAGGGSASQEAAAPSGRERPAAADDPLGAWPGPDVGWWGDLQGLVRAGRGMFQSRLLLLALELQRARQGLVSVLLLLVVAAIAGATAWFALWVGLVALAVHLGLALPWACAGVLVVNLLLLAWVVAAMKSLAPLLSLPASRRQFHWLFNDPRDQEDEAADGRSTAPHA